MKPIRIAILAACTCAIVPVLAQGPMRAGQWERTMQMEMPNMKMPEMKSSQCVTPEQTKDPASAFSQSPTGGSCKVSDQKMTGNKVTWKMACTGQDAMTGDGEITFEGDTYKGTINTKMSQGSMTMRLSGRRTGDCTK
jgi:hypothetical protein